MSDSNHEAILHKGIDAWNAWRATDSVVRPDLAGAALYGARLSGFNLSRTDLRGANLCTTNFADANLDEADLSESSLCSAYLKKASLRNAKLSGADLFSADFRWADLSGADLTAVTVDGSDLRIADLPGIAFINLHLGATNLSGAKLVDAQIPKASFVSSQLVDADLTGADLSDADFRGAQMAHARLLAANLSGADLGQSNLVAATLCGANLSNARLVKTFLLRADLSNCRVYGVSTWDVNLTSATQLNLIITRDDQPTITVDNLEVAQFIYLMLHNDKIRAIIDTITAKAVLILGRFTSERKRVLDALRAELRKRNYVPIVFDFDRPASRDVAETISAIAHMSRFVVADITDARSIPQELQSIVPNLPSVMVQPILQAGADEEYGMFEHFKRFPWVLPLREYAASATADSLVTQILDSVEARALRGADPSPNAANPKSSYGEPSGP